MPRAGGAVAPSARSQVDLVAWAVRAASLAEPLGRRLLERAGRRPNEAREALVRALALRDAL